MALETSLSMASNSDKRDVSRVLRMLECATLFTSADDELDTTRSACASSNALSVCDGGRPPASDMEVGRFREEAAVPCGAADPWRSSPMVAPLAGGSPALVAADITPLCDLVKQCSIREPPATSPLAAAAAMQPAAPRRRPQLQLPQAQAHSGRAMWLEDSPRVGSGSDDDATTPFSHHQPVIFASGVATSPLSAIQKIWAKPLTPQAQGSGSTSAHSGGGGSGNTPPGGGNRFICDLMQATDSASSGAEAEAAQTPASDPAAAAASAAAAVLPPAARLARKQAMAMDLAHLSLSLAPMHGASPISILGRSNGTISPCGSGPWSCEDDSDDDENDSDSFDGTDAPPTPVAGFSVTGSSVSGVSPALAGVAVTAAIDSPRVPRRQRSHAGFDSECPYGGECKQWRLNKCRYWPWHESEGHPLPPPKTPKGTDTAAKHKKKLRKRPSLTPTQRQLNCHPAPAWGTPRGQGCHPSSRGGSITPRFGTPPQPHAEGVWAMAPAAAGRSSHHPGMPIPVSMDPHGHPQHWVHAVPVQMGASPHGMNLCSPGARLIAVAGPLPPPPPQQQHNPHNARGGLSPAWAGHPAQQQQQQRGHLGGHFMPMPTPTFVAVPVPHHPGFHW